MTSPTPTKPREVLELTVNNHPGVMSHVCGLFSRRAFNVEGILCMPIGDGARSRIWLLVNEDKRLDQLVKELLKLVDVTDVARATAPSTASSNNWKNFSEVEILRYVFRVVLRYNQIMSNEPSALAGWTPEQIAQGKRWVETWKRAGVELERIRREELRRVDTQQALKLLCGSADYTVPPRAPKPWSGLVEQQRLFMKAAGRK